MLEPVSFRKLSLVSRLFLCEVAGVGEWLVENTSCLGLEVLPDR